MFISAVLCRYTSTYLGDGIIMHSFFLNIHLDFVLHGNRSSFPTKSDRRCVHVHDMWNISAFKCSPEERKKISLFAYLIFETKKSLSYVNVNAIAWAIVGALNRWKCLLDTIKADLLTGAPKCHSQWKNERICMLSQGNAIYVNVRCLCTKYIPASVVGCWYAYIP